MSAHSEHASQAELDREALDLSRQLHEQALNEVLRASIASWRQRSPAHERAWQHAQSAWQASGSITPQAETAVARLWLALELCAERLSDALREQPYRRGIAAFALCLLLILPLALRFDDDEAAPEVTTVLAPPTSSIATFDYNTTRLQQRAVDLSDGSTLTLNSDSAVTVTLGASERRIELHRGEVLFTVAADTNRPFIVDADGVIATAVGTAFSVRRTGANSARVIVSEGIVQVAHAAEAVLLEAGQQVDAEGTDFASVATIDAVSATAWTEGMLIFRDVPLSEALAEIGRYTSVPIRTGRLTGLERRVTGTYFTARADDALSLIAQAFQLELTQDEDRNVVVSSLPPQRPL